jgi:hypothetical protein
MDLLTCMKWSQYWGEQTAVDPVAPDLDYQLS